MHLLFFYFFIFSYFYASLSRCNFETLASVLNSLRRDKKSERAHNPTGEILEGIIRFPSSAYLGDKS